MNAYIIGSLRNPLVPKVGSAIRALGFDVFDDWYAGGPTADDTWQAYEKDERGHTFAEALDGEAAWHTFRFDDAHIHAADIVVMVMPAGKSGHMELGVAIGRGKRGFVLFDREPERYDVMYRFAEKVFFSEEELYGHLKGLLGRTVETQSADGRRKEEVPERGIRGGVYVGGNVR